MCTGPTGGCGDVLERRHEDVVMFRGPTGGCGDV